MSAPIAKNTLALAWAYGDPGIVHLRRRNSYATLCGRDAVIVEVSRRAVTCDECRAVSGQETP